MQEPTRFGNHLLLKKLGEDPLGGTYRAARIEGESLGQLVFLRIFSLSAIDAKALVASMREYSTSAAPRLKAPGVTHAIDCGAVSGVAYAAYEYVTGWDLKELLRTASTAYSALERDHALLLTERIAKGLDVVHQADPSVLRPCHGFLTPQNVMVTSEGEILLMGFESAAFLATAMAQGQLSADLRSYVSPELRAGAPVGPPDDIYALGALLWELLTGVPPSAEGVGMAANLASAKLTSGEPLPAGLGELLQSSLVAVRARTPHAGAWHKQLTEWLTRNEVRTTHFDLAFSVHELFRKRIQAEEQELEAEKAIDLRPKLAPPAAPPAAPGPPAATATPSSAAVPALERTDVVIPPGKKSGKGMLLGIAALVAVLAGAGWFLLSRGKETPEAPVAAPPPVVTPPAGPAEPARSEGLQLAQAELERLVRERAQAVGEQISAEYDEHIRSLQEQLREAQAAEEEARRLALETAAAESAAAESATAESAAAKSATAESGTAENAAEESAAAESPPPSAEPPPAEPETTAVSPPAAPVQSESPPVEASPPPAPVSPPPPAATTTVAAPPAAAPPPPHQAEIIPPHLKRMPDPVYPMRARQLRREATVLLKVLVDTQGNVVDARPVVDTEDTFGFFQSAIRAARGGSFQPATTDGVPTKMWTTVVITFKM